MLRVAIVGANGKVGRLVCQKLADDTGNFQKPLALVRSEEQKTMFINDYHIDASLTDIEDSSVKQIAAAIKGADAVVFTAGAGGKGIERIFTVDLDGARKVLEACQLNGIRRFIMVSAMKTEKREFWERMVNLKAYYITKSAVDDIIVNKYKDLDYTILQPGSLLDDPAKGKLQPLDRLEERKLGFYGISRSDVAEFIRLCLMDKSGKTVRKFIPLSNGDMDMQDYLNSL